MVGDGSGSKTCCRIVLTRTGSQGCRDLRPVRGDESDRKGDGEQAEWALEGTAGQEEDGGWRPLSCQDMDVLRCVSPLTALRV